MNYQKGRVFDDLAAKSGAPQTRAEVEAMLARTPDTEIAIFVKRWLILDDELAQIHAQAAHVEQMLGDKLLGIMLGERVSDITETMRRRALDLARLPAACAEDVGAKCYVRARMRELDAQDESATHYLCKSVQRDVKALGIKVERRRREARSH